MGTPVRHIIFGGNGFIGSKLRNFIKDSEVVVAKGDFRDKNIVSMQIKKDDYVWSLAASMGGVGFFTKQQYYPTLDNFEIDINILRVCEENGAGRLFYPSSACAYNLDLMNQGVILEELMLDWNARPDQMYGWEKLTMTKLMRESPVDCRVGVLHTIYGEGQAYKGDKAKFPPQIAHKMIQAVKTGEVEVWGNGKQTRTFLYIDDAIEKIYEVMMSDTYNGEVNIGSDKEVSVNEVIDVCKQILGIDPEIKYNKDKPTGPKRRLCSNEKFNEHYTTREKVDLKEGFTRLINYIKEHEKV